MIPREIVDGETYDNAIAVQLVESVKFDSLCSQSVKEKRIYKRIEIGFVCAYSVLAVEFK